MADGKNILLTHMERGLIQRMGQVLAEGRINPDLETFTANDMANAIRGATGVPVNPRALGVLLDRMGVSANRRDYRRLMAVLQDILPEWVAAADSMQSSQIRLPNPSL